MMSVFKPLIEPHATNCHGAFSLFPIRIGIIERPDIQHHFHQTLALSEYPSC